MTSEGAETAENRLALWLAAQGGCLVYARDPDHVGLPTLRPTPWPAYACSRCSRLATRHGCEDHTTAHLHRVFASAGRQHPDLVPAEVFPLTMPMRR